MRKRKELVIGFLCLGMVCCGCAQTTQLPENQTEIKEEAISQEKVEEEITSETELETEQAPETESEAEQAPETGLEEETTADLTFEDLSEKQFWFSSGAGGWADEFTIEKDGYFSGEFHDSDMGSTGEGYPNGSLYISRYFGYFSNLTKVDDYTYQMTRSELSYKDEIGKEEIRDDVLHIYTEAYALGGSDTFTVYLPGTPLSRFSEDVWIWLQYDNESETELTMTVIVDEENQYGICSYERMTPAATAKTTYETYQESYDFYEQKLQEAMTTLEMNEAASRMYEVSDECLNELWRIIQYNVTQEKYDEILAQQREWISEKEAAAGTSEEESDEGTLAPIDSMLTMAEMTIKRCEELLEFLEPK